MIERAAGFAQALIVLRYDFDMVFGLSEADTKRIGLQKGGFEHFVRIASARSYDVRPARWSRHIFGP